MERKPNGTDAPLSRFFGCGCSERPPSELQPTIWAGFRNEWRRVTEMTDEFHNVFLSSRKWFPYCPFSFGEKPGLFIPANVSIQNRIMRLTARSNNMPLDAPNGYHTWTTSALVSRNKMLYGYFECCFRASHSNLESSFYLIGQENGVLREINAFSYSGAPDHKEFIYMNACCSLIKTEGNKNLLEHPLKKLIFDMPESPITVGIDWTPDYVRTYVDGQLIRQLDNKHWHIPLQVGFSLQIRANHFGMPTREFYREEDDFEVYYIRAWKRYPNEKKVDGPGL